MNDLFLIISAVVGIILFIIGAYLDFVYRKEQHGLVERFRDHEKKSKLNNHEPDLSAALMLAVIEPDDISRLFVNPDRHFMFVIALALIVLGIMTLLKRGRY